MRPAHVRSGEILLPYVLESALRLYTSSSVLSHLHLRCHLETKSSQAIHTVQTPVRVCIPESFPVSSSWGHQAGAPSSFIRRSLKADSSNHVTLSPAHSNLLALCPETAPN